MKGEVSEPKNKMTPEQLLKPRYKVIADYPDNPEKAGFIYSGNQWADSWYKKMAKYPAIFKPLAWWEDREASEMPEYVKWNYMPQVDKKEMDGYVQKVYGWSQAGYGVITEGNTITASKNWLPATETDFNQYLKTKQK